MEAHGAQETPEGTVLEHTLAAVPVGVNGEGELNGGHAPVSVWAVHFLWGFWFSFLSLEDQGRGLEAQGKRLLSSICISVLALLSCLKLNSTLKIIYGLNNICLDY